jgi:hypothetical protein
VRTTFANALDDPNRFGNQEHSEQTPDAEIRNGQPGNEGENKKACENK